MDPALCSSAGDPGRLLSDPLAAVWWGWGALPAYTQGKITLKTPLIGSKKPSREVTKTGILSRPTKIWKILEVPRIIKN